MLPQQEVDLMSDSTLAKNQPPGQDFCALSNQEKVSLQKTWRQEIDIEPQCVVNWIAGFQVWSLPDFKQSGAHLQKPKPNG